jgi:hypothetical protein
MKVEPRKRSHRRADEDHRVERLFVCRVAGLTSPSPPSGTLMRGSGRGWGYAWTIRLESLLWWCCGRNKCVFITSERSTNTCFVFPIIGSKLQNASCIQIMRHPSIQEIFVKRPKQPRNGSSKSVPGSPRMHSTSSPGPVGWQRSPTSSVAEGPCAAPAMWQIEHTSELFEASRNCDRLV